MRYSTITALALIASMTGLSTMVASAPKPECNQACSMEYAPVCAKFSSGKTKQFGNNCALDVYKCEHPKDKVKSVTKRECSKLKPNSSPVCNKACTRDYKPVCVKFSSGETRQFSNTCLFEVYKCEHPKDKVKSVAKRECPKPPPVCDGICPDIYAPVCAKLANGKRHTFDNQCRMDVYKCEHPKEKVSLVSGSKACENLK
ncbi:hypothetical protein BGX29_009035 [Mortierella sp. GBA35]|nr:hypothetical protein BGX29_009035 [Mortierella sp. GBA35]